MRVERNFPRIETTEPQQILPRHLQNAPTAAVSGFSTFGSVTEPTTGSYTLTEQGNAGIYQTVTLPMNVSTLKFRVQFTQPGDGDFVEVSFGDHLSLAVIADGSIVRAGLVEFEVPVGALWRGDGATALQAERARGG